MALYHNTTKPFGAFNSNTMKKIIFLSGKDLSAIGNRYSETIPEVGSLVSIDGHYGQVYNIGYEYTSKDIFFYVFLAIREEKAPWQ